jgi:hypothetical protein
MPSQGLGGEATRAVSWDVPTATTRGGETAGGDAPISISSSGMTPEFTPPQSYADAARRTTTTAPITSCESSGTYSIQVRVGDDGKIIPTLAPTSPLYEPSDSHPSAGATAPALSAQNPVGNVVSHIINILRGQDPL